MWVCIHTLKCCSALLSLVSPVLFTLMLAQETFSILPQDRLGKLLSSGLKVSLCDSGSLAGRFWRGQMCQNARHGWGLVSTACGFSCNTACPLLDMSASFGLFA